MKSGKRLSREEEVALFKAGNPNAVVEAHLPLVYGMASRYSRSGQSFDDCVQQGCVGLMRAAAKFDPGHGTRFYTYATNWVRAEMSAFAAASSRMVKMPHSPAFSRALSAFRGRRVESLDDLLKIEGVDVATAEMLWPFLASKDLRDEVTFPDGDVAERCRSTSDPELECAEAAIVAAIRAAVDALPEMERTLVRIRMEDEEATLRSAGEHIGVSRTTAMKLERSAYASLAIALCEIGGEHKLGRRVKPIANPCNRCNKRAAEYGGKTCETCRAFGRARIQRHKERKAAA